MHNPTYICPTEALLFDRPPCNPPVNSRHHIPSGTRFGQQTCFSRGANSSSSSCCFLRDETKLHYVDWASLPLPHARISLPARRTPPTHTLSRLNVHPHATPLGLGRGPVPGLAAGRVSDIHGTSPSPCSTRYSTSRLFMGFYFYFYFLVSSIKDVLLLREGWL